jgi:hypothetical protein
MKTRLIADDAVKIAGWLATADRGVTAEAGLTRYFKEIRRFPMRNHRKNTYWPSAGANTVTARRRTSSSPAICASSSRPPCAIAATVCRPWR